MPANGDNAESNSMAQSPLTRRASICTIALLTGSVVMIEELLAAGWLAPVFGSGIEVWAAILGVTLFAMALGYFIGSFVARRVEFANLAWLLTGCCLSLLAATFGFRSALLPDPSSEITLGTLLGYTSAVLGIPILPLAVVSPCLVHVYSATGEDAGRASGVTYAVSTLGGVGGAIGAGFWAIPGLGLPLATLTGCWLLVAACGCCAIATGARRQAAIATCVAAGLTASTHLIGPIAASAEPGLSLRLLERQHTWYGQHGVYEDGSLRYLFVNGVPQSALLSKTIDVAERTNASPAYPRLAMLRSGYVTELLPYLRPARQADHPQRALVVGLGAGIVVNLFEQYGCTVESVEIDPAMLDLAQRYFCFRGQCTIEDGRRYLARMRHDYEFIHIDVYRGEDLPAHMTTVEFYELVAERLTPDGIVALNLIGEPEAPDSGALLKTLRAAFRYVELHANSQQQGVATLTALASEAPLTITPKIRARLGDNIASLVARQRIDLESWDWPSYAVLQDTRNPISILRRGTGREWRRRWARRLSSRGPRVDRRSRR